jgi:hypothetical protein
MGGLDLEDAQEEVLASVAGEATDDLIASFKKEKQSLDQFREALEDAVQVIAEDGEKHPLIFFIDELDRCRPSFAIELLERVKHLFDVKNIIFVLSIDKKQLEAITAAVYGERIDAPEYLRRFVDIELSLPMPHTKGYTEDLIKRFDFGTFFAARRKNSELAYDYDHFVEAFTLLSASFGLSLRARERCLTRLALALTQTAENHYLDPIVLATLIVLRIKRKDIFENLISGNLDPQKVLPSLRDIAVSQEFFNSRIARIVEAYLVFGDVDRERLERVHKELVELAKAEPQSERGVQAGELLRMQRHVEGQWGRFSILRAAKKVDLLEKMDAGW